MWSRLHLIRPISFPVSDFPGQNAAGKTFLIRGRPALPIGSQSFPNSCKQAEVPLSRFSPRSEEHTSELQSRGHLVCRLLLEKKKKFPSTPTLTTSPCKLNLFNR